MLNNEPAQLNLLKKLQEATTSDVDEERGSFKKGDKVTYAMFGAGLTNSDFIRMLGTDEHATRANHNKTIAEVVEAVGEEVSRYSIMFEDGFVINDVAACELKSVKEDTVLTQPIVKGYEVFNYLAQALYQKQYDALNSEEKKEVDDAVKKIKDIPLESKTNEAEDAVQTMKPREKPNINAEDLHMEDYSEDDLEKVKSKSAETGNAIRQVDGKELKIEPDKVVEPKKESKIDEQDIDPRELKLSVRKSKISHDMYGKSYADLTSEEAEIVDRELNKGESKLKEQEGKSVIDVLIGKASSFLNAYRDNNWPMMSSIIHAIDSFISNNREKLPNDIVDVYQKKAVKDGKVTNDSMKLFASWIVKNYKMKESKLKEEETEVTPSRAEFKKIGDEQLKRLHKNACRSYDYWKKDGTVPEKVSAIERAVERYEEELLARGLMLKAGEAAVAATSEKKESRFSFMKKQKPLWLCNECFKTFRANEAICENCKSKKVERIAEQYGPGFTKEVFKVTWKNTDTGKEESTRVMAFDKADARKEAKRSNREITKVEGPIMEEPRKEEAKVPFDESSEGSKLLEGVHELVSNVPGIDKEEQAALHKAIEDGVISNKWPSEEEIVDALVKAEIDPHIVDDADMGELRQIYLKHILLTQAMKLARVASESKLSEQEVEGVPEKGQTYRILRKLGIGLPEGTYEITNVEYRWTTKGDLAKHFQVVGDDRWWVAKFYGFKEAVSEFKINEQEEDWDLTFQYGHNLIWHNPLRDKEGNPFIWQKHPITGKKIRVFSDYQANWVERNKGVPIRGEIEEAKKEIESITAIEIVRSKVDPDAYNIRVVELPEGSIVILDSVSDREEAIKRGKEFARVLNAKFIGIIDESITEATEEEYAYGLFHKKLDELNVLEKEVIRIWREEKRVIPPEFSKWDRERAKEKADSRLKHKGKLSKLDKLGLESKLKEQEEDTFKTVAKGITDKADADKLAKEKEGQVVQDEEDRTKFAVLVKVE